MKKIISILTIAIVSMGLISAQVLPKPESGKMAVENTLSTVVGLPYGENGSERSLQWYGVHETLQARADIGIFTIDGMLNWGALTNYWWDDGWWDNFGVYHPGHHNFNFTIGLTNRTPFTYTNDFMQGDYITSGYTDSYYLNFVVHPFSGDDYSIDLGMGTRLNWVVGPAPNYNGMLWEPTSHIVQGGLKAANPLNEQADVSGFVRYANDYARTAIAARFVNQYVEVGVAIPSGATIDGFITNFGIKITPIDLISFGIAFEGVWNGDSNLYTGLTLNISEQFKVEAWGAFDNLGGVKDDGQFGTGARVTIGIEAINMTLKPEFGVSFWEYEYFSPAVYCGIRMDWWLMDKLLFGAWTSFAWGSLDTWWQDEYRTGGFIWDFKPDVTFLINDRHSISAMFDLQLRTSAYYNRNYSTWATAVYWTYKL